MIQTENTREMIAEYDYYELLPSRLRQFNLTCVYEVCQTVL